jgi:hypothetical protein
MATPLQIANDLRAMAKAHRGRHIQGETCDPLVRSLERGARTIEELVGRLAALEAGAEAPRVFAERHRHGPF